MKTLVVYYSQSGNAQWMAERIASAISADMLRLVPKKAYPEKGFGYIPPLLGCQAAPSEGPPEGLQGKSEVYGKPEGLQGDSEAYGKVYRKKEKLLDFSFGLCYGVL